MVATDGDPVTTIIDGNNNDTHAIQVYLGGNNSFYLNGFTIQNGGNGNERVGAGIFVEDGGTVNIVNNIIKDNDAGTGHGGGLYTRWATGIVSRNIFVNNLARYGSAVRLNEGGINFYNNTLWNNGTEHGGVLRINSTDHRIVNNIISDDHTDDFQFIWYNSGLSINYNIIKLASNYNYGTGNIDDDPGLIDPDNGNFRPHYTSPAIDAGDPDLDQDGITWESDPDDQDPDGSRLDIGARYPV